MAGFLGLNTINILAQMILDCGRWNSTHRRIFSSINGLYLWDARATPTPLWHQECLQMLPNILWGGAGDKNHFCLRAIYYKRTPWWLKSVLDFFFFFILWIICLSVHREHGNQGLLCFRTKYPFFLARVVWDKLPNFRVSIPLSVWDVEVKHTLASP